MDKLDISIAEQIKALEKENAELRRQNMELNEKLSNIYEVLSDMPCDIDELLEEAQ